jgi:hypothetical protein
MDDDTPFGVRVVLHMIAWLHYIPAGLFLHIGWSLYS